MVAGNLNCFACWLERKVREVPYDTLYEGLRRLVGKIVSWHRDRGMRSIEQVSQASELLANLIELNSSAKPIFYSKWVKG